RGPWLGERRSSAKRAGRRRRGRRSPSWRARRAGRRGRWTWRARRLFGICLRSFFLLRALSAAPKAVHQIFQIAPDHFFEQVCFRPLKCSANFEIDCRITGLLRWLKICLDWLKKLRANLFVDGEPRT